MRALRKHVLFGVLLFNYIGEAQSLWSPGGDLENYISHEDLHVFNRFALESRFDVINTDFPNDPVLKQADCFGLGPLTRLLPKIFNMKPGAAGDVDTHFYFSSRKKSTKDRLYHGKRFDLKGVDFNAKRLTVMIIHGFMSYSNASWVNEMTNAFLKWKDVNVFAVDWSKGGNTWKYWRAVSNTRRVGSDISKFVKQLIDATGVKLKNIHFVGHSLGAHIASYASNHLDNVARITGLDPAQPCYKTSEKDERLDKSDADFVDIIHTNGKFLNGNGFGLPLPLGHADFYPNGGLNQPGCKKTIWQRFSSALFGSLQQAVCSHGRSYILFTESLVNEKCAFLAHRWDLSYEGVNASLKTVCKRGAACAEMGINAAGGKRSDRANQYYFILTGEKDPYCLTDWKSREPPEELLKELKDFTDNSKDRFMTVYDDDREGAAWVRDLESLPAIKEKWPSSSKKSRKPCHLVQ